MTKRIICLMMAYVNTVEIRQHSRTQPGEAHWPNGRIVVKL